MKEAFLLFGFLWEFISTWWWLFLPFLLFKPAVFLWQWWRKEVFSSQQRYILLEIKMPEDAPRPFKAMEDVFTSMWQMHDPPNSREKWLEGKYQLAFALEMVSTQGEIHFYFRIPEGAQKLVESSIFAHYPSAELVIAEDYTKQIPQDIPNKEWDLWGTNYVLERPSPYPIKTYTKFFEPTATDKEEMRVDPMALLVEGLSTIGKGEHIWVQFVLTPILHTNPNESKLVEEGREIVAELVHRKGPLKPKSLIQDVQEVGSHVVTGIKAEEMAAEYQEIIPPEMRLTPGERDIVSAIEEKISKYSFAAHSRFIYIAKRENYFGPAKALPMSWFTQFGTATYNNFRPLKPTLTKVYTIFTWFMDKRRAFVRKRRLFRNYTLRLPPFFPQPGGTFVLNTEELATIFHFPGRITAPSSAVMRVGSKKGEAPFGLPME
ncbi:MAG: hypothetical protein Q8P55_02475 [bacterium]|nr:hypothetical protein [bacterium]